MDVAPGLKTIGDAAAIRARILTAFEQAEVSEDPLLRVRLLTFVVVGGGPTGVELAGAIVELARKAIVADFRNIDSSTARVVLVEAGPRLLPAFPERLSQSAKRQLEKLGVEVLLGHAVTQSDEHGVVLADGSTIGSTCVLWAAGVTSSRSAPSLEAEADRAGRTIVGDDLSVPGQPEIFVIGDTALVMSPDGSPVPGVAPAAKQMGKYVARVIKARLAGKRHGQAVPLHQLRQLSLRSAAKRLSPISAGYGSAVSSRGSCGALPICGSWSASATASSSSSNGHGPMSPIDRGARLITNDRLYSPLPRMVDAAKNRARLRLVVVGNEFGGRWTQTQHSANISASTEFRSLGSRPNRSSARVFA